MAAEVGEADLDFQAPAVSLPPTPEALCLIEYYMRLGFYGHVVNVCDTYLQQSARSSSSSSVSLSEGELKFWRAVGLSESGSVTESIREFDYLLRSSNSSAGVAFSNGIDMSLALTAALIQAHKNINSKEKDVLNNLKENLKNLSKSSDDAALVFAGRYFLWTDKAKQARQCIEKVYTKQQQNVEVLVLLGWLNLTSGNSRYERKSVSFFEAALKLTHEKNDIGALLGRVRYYERKRKLEKVLEDLNRIIVSYDGFNVALCEKARVLMQLNNYDEMLSTIQRVDKNDLQALRLLALYELTREPSTAGGGGSGGSTNRFNNATVSPRLNELIDAMDRVEGKHAKLYYQTAQLFARVANRRRPILQQALVLVERACKLDPNNSSYLTEQGYQLLLLQEIAQASLCFQEAAKLDEGNLTALYGNIKCKIFEGKIKETKEELEFLSEIQSTIGISPELTYLQALVSSKSDNAADEANTVSLLTQCIAEHHKQVEDNSALLNGFELLTLYNPDFVLEIADLFFTFVSAEPALPSDPPSPSVQALSALLSELISYIPFNINAQIYYAKILFLSGNFDAAERQLQTILRTIDNSNANVFILLAQISMYRENYKACSQYLEQARSLDFEVRNTPVYHLMKAKLLEASGSVEDSLKVLQASMVLPGVRRSSANFNQKAAYPVSLQDRISLYIELSKINAKLGNLNDSQKTIIEAKNEFKASQEITRITLAEADLAVKRKDFDAALALLRGIPSSNIYYTRGKIKMADIYLHHKKNRKLYAQVYQELANSKNNNGAGNNNIHSFLLLGEAYMKIQEPERAIAAFENALQLNPSDFVLASKIGKALITTHDYEKAVKYYRGAIENNSEQSAEQKMKLMSELIELYISLKRYDEAIGTIQASLNINEQKKKDGTYEDDINAMLSDVKCMLFLAEIYNLNNSPQTEQALLDGFNLQLEILAKLRGIENEVKKEQKDIAANICFRLGEYYKKINITDKASNFYNEALKHNELHEKARMNLSKLYIINNEIDLAQQQCVTLLKIDPNHKEASLLLTDLMFRKNEYEAATYHFTQLLEKNPLRFDALAKLIQLLRHAGRLNDAPRFLKLAEKNHPTKGGANFSAGLHYCRGLLHWYKSENKQALSEFNFARKDNEWGRQSLLNMIEIYLNPDNLDLFKENVNAETSQTYAKDASEQLDSAEKLIGELRTFAQQGALSSEAVELDQKIRVLESYALMASKNKAKIEKAVNDLMALCGNDGSREYVPALLALSNALVLKGEPAKARNNLKRISKMKFDPEYSTEFERSWLMLADIYIEIGKYEFAQELCKKCLQINKSSAKSWEMLGSILEKEQAYKDAADHYEQAWLFTHESNAALGFKLAFNYLKAKRYIEAIDVCHKVLALSADYPKIRKEILAKAREALKP